MHQWIKYSICAIALIAIIAIAGYYYNQQNASVTSVQEIKTTLKTNLTGSLRSEEKTKMTKKEWVSSVIAETVDVQKSLQKNLKIDFVFLDEKGKKTNQESEIESVQIRTFLLNDKGNPETQSVQRISLKQK